MSSLVASAPGKLLLGGEYAVLDGAPAVAMAVDRRAVVTVEPADGLSRVAVRGHRARDATFESERGGLIWRSGGEDLPLFGAVWAASGVMPAQPLSFHLDTHAFRDRESGLKFGLGSSSALAAALAAALASIGGRDAAVIAPEAHRAFQDGEGSSVDVACSLTGGVIEYRMAGAGVTQLDWPRGLEHAVLWSGRSADTRASIARLRSAAASPSRRDLATAGGHLASAWRRGDAASVLGAMRAFTDVLLRFDVDHGLGIFEAGHATLAEAAAGFDAVYKPCGAGGGDVGIALARTAGAVRSFVEFAAGHRFRQLDLKVDPVGVRVVGDLAT